MKNTIRGRLAVSNENGTLVFYDFRADAVETKDPRLSEDLANQRLSYIRDIESVTLRNVTITGGGFEDPWNKEPEVGAE